MWKKIIFSVIVLGTGFSISAKELKYPVSAIPPALKENAHTVVRHQQLELEIKSEKSAVLTVTEVRTILNKNGEDNGRFEETYDPLHKITYVKGRVFDESGAQIKKFGYDDIVDRSYISGYSMYESSRIKFIDPRIQTYPYTVEYSYQEELNETFNLPVWNHFLENRSYENSVFVVKLPAGYVFRYKEYNLPKGVVKTSQDGQDIYTWNLTNLKARTHEPMKFGKLPYAPEVRLAPDNFQVEDSKGSAKSWRDLGIWETSLLVNRDQLPEASKAKILEITSACKSDFEKVRRVYEYMQQKTRYVSIQVGLGGWQPFDAATVDRLSYGDCKALSNYTKALLAVAGIKSYYISVNADEDGGEFDASFPSNQFNHVMLCVPLAKDTLWLECTSQRKPCGFNGDFTDDRDVLLVDGENSRLVHTRVYSAKENCVSRTSNVVLTDEESGEATVKANYRGLASEEIDPIYYADAVDKTKKVTNSIELPSFTLQSFDYKENRGFTPSYDESLKLTFSNYVRKMGDNLLLPVNFINKLSSLPEKVRNRQTEMCISHSYMESDTVIYQLPKAMQVTGLPDKSEIKSQFGKYSAYTVQEGNTITYFRQFELYKGIFPPDAYADFRDFLEQIASNDGAVVSLKKQSSVTAAQ
jgi:Transglutaminase-like enzymes, putative cysteine proteases